LYAVWRGAVLFTRLASFRAVRFGDGWAGAIRVRFGRFLWISCSPISYFSAPEHAVVPVWCQRVAGSSPASGAPQIRPSQRVPTEAPKPPPPPVRSGYH